MHTDTHTQGLSLRGKWKSGGERSLCGIRFEEPSILSFLPFSNFHFCFLVFAFCGLIFKIFSLPCIAFLSLVWNNLGHRSRSCSISQWLIFLSYFLSYSSAVIIPALIILSLFSLSVPSSVSLNLYNSSHFLPPFPFPISLSFHSLFPPPFFPFLPLLSPTSFYLLYWICFTFRSVFLPSWHSLCGFPCSPFLNFPFFFCTDSFMLLSFTRS